MQRGTTHRNDCSPHVIPLLSLAESMEGWTHSFSSPFMLHGRRLASRSVVLASTREAVECDWVLSSSLIIDEQCLSFKTSQPLHLKRDFSKETSQKRLLRREKRGKERERTTHNTLSSTSHVSYLIGHRTMKHGKGEKEEREGKRRRGGEKRGRKGDFKANRPLLFSGGCEGRACAPEHVIAIWRRLVVLKAEAKPRLSTRLDRQSQIAISDADTKWKSAGSSIYPPNRRAIARFLIELFAFEINWVLLRSAVEWCIVGGRWVEVMMSCHAKCYFRRIGRE